MISDAYALFKKEEGNFGGAEINLYYLATEFAKRKEYRVEFLVSDFGQENIEMHENVRVVKLKWLNDKKYPGIPYKIMRRVYLIYSLIINKSEIYITTTASEYSAYFILIGKYIRRKKVVFRVAHEWDIDKSLSSLSTIPRVFHRYSLPRFDQIIVQSDIQKRLLSENYNLNSVLIANGFPVKDYNEQPERDYILWVGRSAEFKRPDLFVKLAGELPNEKFLMILSGENDLKEKIKENASDVLNIRIIDFVSFFDIDEVFIKAKCFVNTSVKEGFPNTFIQSGLASTPILSFNVDPDGILEKYSMGFCCNEDMQKAIQYLHKLDKQTMSRMGENALRYVNEHHLLKDKVNDYNKIFLDLLK
jgi:glycosyltransferase involved in cell wall biosynthesis